VSVVRGSTVFAFDTVCYSVRLLLKVSVLSSGNEVLRWMSEALVLNWTALAQSGFKATICERGDDIAHKYVTPV
jgi:hypothetical protein